jgi:hypothetical protein
MSCYPPRRPVPYTGAMRALFLLAAFAAPACLVRHPTIDPPDHALQAAQRAEARAEAASAHTPRAPAPARRAEASPPADAPPVEAIDLDAPQDPADPDTRAEFAKALEDDLLDQGWRIHWVRAVDADLVIEYPLCSRVLTRRIAVHRAVDMRQLGFERVRCYDGWHHEYADEVPRGD